MQDKSRPIRLLSDIVWFIRQPISEAKIMGDNVSAVDIIADRCNIFDDPSQEMEKHNLDLSEKIKLSEIAIAYRRDRYGQLGLKIVKYDAPRVNMKRHVCKSSQDFEIKKKELLHSGLCITTSKDEMWIEYRDENDTYFTVGDILEHIYLFYHQILSPEELSAVSQTDDSFGYADKARKAQTTNKVLYRHEIMGDCMHFEGLRWTRFTNGNHAYLLNLGS